jgi:SAM-dependent methyltransferase
MCGGRLRPRWPTIQMDACAACGLLFRNPRPRPGQLDALYEESWVSPEESVGDTGGTIDALADVYARKLAEALRVRDFAGLRVLDYGAGRGAMAAALRRLRGDVWAVEPYGVEYLRAQGLNAVARLEDLPADHGFDGVVTIDVVEHLLEPWTDLEACRRLLKRDGWIFVATPNAGGLRAALRGPGWEEAARRSHVTLFTPRGCAAVLRRSGFGAARRLRWRVDYGRGRAVRAVHTVLQALGVDGELRYLARPA